MADYQRFISYMYLYEGDAKGRNTGFVKVEARGYYRRIEAVVRRQPLLDGLASVWAFYREGNFCRGVLLGRMTISGGNGNFLWSSLKNTVENSRCQFEQLAGILIWSERSENICVTLWDDSPFSIGLFSPEKEELHAAEVEEEMAEEITEQEEKFVEEAIEEAVEQTEEFAEETVKQEEEFVEEAIEQEEESAEEAIEQEEEFAEEAIEQQEEEFVEEEIKQEGEFVEEAVEQEAESVEGVGQQQGKFVETVQEGAIGQEESVQEVVMKQDEEWIEGVVQQKEIVAAFSEQKEAVQEVAVKQAESLIEEAVKREEKAQEMAKEQDKEGQERLLGQTEAHAGARLELSGKSQTKNILRQEPNKIEQIKKDDTSDRKYEERDLNVDLEQFFPKDSNPWEKLCGYYPKIKPFAWDKDMYCLKIKPGDLGRLPKENWIMGNNSFMLHGYYVYRYLILMQLEQGESKRYILGVPGIYGNRERFMADMFGFKEFISINQKRAMQGQKGFWCVEITV